jgi:tetratricopeptide (TPR) repeat protein
MYTRNNLGWLYNENEHFADAELLHRYNLEARRRVLGESAFETSRSRRNLIIALRGQGEIGEVAKVQEEELHNLRRKCTADDADATEMNTYAWLLLTIEVSDLRDPASALPIAQRAVEMSSGIAPNILDTLARAYFDTGDIENAIKTQEKAVSLAPSDNLYYQNELDRYRKAWEATGNETDGE